jgi:asparagine synthase (glutamine-hydrolysing)
MCGISGIINKDNRVVNSDQIKKMNDLIIHRGPDDEGFYFGDNFAFGHRRLSIIDLSSYGHQPMSYMDRYVITYNGEIYNYIELKEELLNYGYSFNSHTDTEVILAGFDRWGESCVERFNGMWAFAIYDKERDTIFCSRDRFGIKPFYYAFTEENLFFGSEIKQILSLFEKNYVDKSVMLDYLLYTLEGHNEKTFFKDIKKIPPGYNLLYDLKSHKFQLKQYYCLKSILKARVDKQIALETIIEDSV